MDEAVTYVLLAVLGFLVLFAFYHAGRMALGIARALLDRRSTREAAEYVEALGKYERMVAALPRCDGPLPRLRRILDLHPTAALR